jgi:hypothetical protein
MWSQAGARIVDRLRELDELASVGDVVLDGEVVVLRPDQQRSPARLTSVLSPWLRQLP